MRRDKIPATSNLAVHTKHDATESINYHSKSKAWWTGSLSKHSALAMKCISDTIFMEYTIRSHNIIFKLILDRFNFE